jgi:hypothetical protein
MSTDNQNQNQNQTISQQTNKEYVASETLAFDAWVNDTGAGDLVRLPQDGGTIVVKFSKDKGKRKLVKRTFEDKKTGERSDSIRAEYMVMDPNTPLDQSEKKLEVPRTLAYQIEKNIDRNHLVLEITRHGQGLNTRYTVVAA